MIVDQAQPGDEQAIADLLHARPGADNGRWMPVEGGIWLVARDDRGVAAFLASRIDLDRATIFADQLEGHRIDGQTTVRGVRGIKLLGDFLHRKADALGATVILVVARDNHSQSSALTRYGYEHTANVYLRQPRG